MQESYYVVRPCSGKRTDAMPVVGAVIDRPHVQSGREAARRGAWRKIRGR